MPIANRAKRQGWRTQASRWWISLGPSGPPQAFHVQKRRCQVRQALHIRPKAHSASSARPPGYQSLQDGDGCAPFVDCSGPRPIKRVPISAKQFPLKSVGQSQRVEALWTWSTVKLPVYAIGPAVAAKGQIVCEHPHIVDGYHNDAGQCCQADINWLERENAPRSFLRSRGVVHSHVVDEDPTSLRRGRPCSNGGQGRTADGRHIPKWVRAGRSFHVSIDTHRSCVGELHWDEGNAIHLFARTHLAESDALIERLCEGR